MRLSRYHEIRWAKHIQARVSSIKTKTVPLGGTVLVFSTDVLVNELRDEGHRFVLGSASTREGEERAELVTAE